MVTIPSQEIKRCGISVLDRVSHHEPVHVIRNNRPEYVILREEAYQMMMQDLALARVASSEADLKAGRYAKGTAAELMQEVEDPENG